MPFGRKSRRSNRNKTVLDVADVIERFLEGRSLYPQEWNDFVDRSQRNKIVDAYRKRCYELDPLVNRPGEPDPDAIAELRKMIGVLRQSEMSPNSE
jgi:hypothetical protein